MEQISQINNKININNTAANTNSTNHSVNLKSDDPHALAALIASGRQVLEIETAALAKLTQRIDINFARACQLILNCQGAIIVTGMGKSGHVGKKIAATFSSTGTPAYFMHPGEALHGDLGVITKKDLLLALSNSGETGEILAIIPAIKRLGIPLIVLTGNANSQLANYADVRLDISVTQEACPFDLAPTASTITSLAMGDALALSILQAKGFTREDFAFSHPGGKLGKRLLTKVADVMYTGDNIPTVSADASLLAAILEITNKRLGFTVIVAGRQIIGIFTDGDLRRVLLNKLDIHATKVAEVMTSNFKTIQANILAHEAAHIMEKYKITALPVVNAAGELVGALNVHNLFKSGII